MTGGGGRGSKIVQICVTSCPHRHSISVVGSRHIYQVVSSSWHVNKKDSKISNFCSKFRAPRYLALQDHLVGVHVVQVGSFGQQEHSLLGEESFFLVEDSLTDDEVALDEAVIVVVLGLFFQPEVTNKQDWLRPGVDFIKVGRTAQIIEIALLKLGARRKARSTPLKSFSKVGRRAQNSL